jgi:hypothetical protein
VSIHVTLREKLRMELQPERVNALDWQRRNRVMCPLLPAPELIRREIRALCPDPAFDPHLRPDAQGWPVIITW